MNYHFLSVFAVSTHSRLKAAGTRQNVVLPLQLRFNTQPPEGGWAVPSEARSHRKHVSTHSRLKAAGHTLAMSRFKNLVSTHSRLKAAGDVRKFKAHELTVSTHSRLKAAGPEKRGADWLEICFNTQPPEGGWAVDSFSKMTFGGFNTQPPEGGWQHDH